MNHRERVESEFTRQAEAFANAPALNAPEVTETVVAALGAARRGRVVDLACGPGIVSSVLELEAREVIALELTPRPLRMVRERCGERTRVVRGSVESLPLRGSSCDGAVLRLALHHLEHPERALAEAHRVVRPGGRLVVLDLIGGTEPAEAELRDALERLRDPSHVHTLSRETLHRVLLESGWREPEWVVTDRRRTFEEWAAIIADPVRTSALEVVMRRLAREGVRAGIDLCEEGEKLSFTYRFGLVSATR